MQTELKAAAAEFKAAPTRLKEKIYEAAQTPDEDGNLPTAVDIAKAVDFVYNPDYIRKLLSQRLGRRSDRQPRES